MGYYIPNNIPVLQRPNTYQINEPTSLKDVRPDEAIICEVDNGPFKANAFAYSEGELQVFRRPDGRPKKWFKMPLSQAQKLSGY